MRPEVALLLLLAGTATPGLAAEQALAFKAAWAPAAEKGADTSLYMTVENGGAEDAIIRVRCEAANFTELRTVDRGEGFPSARRINAIPITAEGETIFKPDGFSVRLLQLTGPLASGETFECALRLRGGSQHHIAVTVRSAVADSQ